MTGVQTCALPISVVLNIIKEKGVQKPNVMGVIPIKEVKLLKTVEKGPPTLGKVSSTFKPQPFDPGVVGGPNYRKYN